jgi:hypothetical protein
MARRSTLRASDADREQVAERLRKAAGEGRLLAEELEERLGEVFSARTYGELDAVVVDLPRGEALQRARSRTLPKIPATPVSALALVVVIPVVVALVIAAVVVVATLFAAWAALITVIWLALGHKRPPYYPARYRRSVQAYSRRRA